LGWAFALAGFNPFVGTLNMATNLRLNGSMPSTLVNLRGGTLDAVGAVGGINGLGGIITTGGVLVVDTIWTVDTSRTVYQVVLSGNAPGVGYGQLLVNGNADLTGLNSTST
jgi:hypothetical protein